MTAFASFRRRFILFLLTLIIILATLLALSSQLTQWYLTRWFEQQGVNLETEQLNLNLYDATLDVEHLSATNDSGRRLSVEKLSVDWAWQGLLDRALKIHQIRVNGLKLDVVGDEFKPLFIGPLDLAKLQSGDDSEVSPEAPPGDWSVNLGPVELRNSELCYHDVSLKAVDLGLPLKTPGQQVNNCVGWWSLGLDSQLALDSKGQIGLQGNIELAGLDVKDWVTVGQLKIKALDLSKQQLAWDTIKLDKMVLFDSPLVSDSRLSLEQLSLDKSTVELEHLTAGLGPLGLTDLVISHQDNTLAVGKISAASVIGGMDNLALETGVIEQLKVTSEGAQLTVGKLLANSLTAETPRGKIGLDELALVGVDGVYEDFSGTLGQLSIKGINGELHKQVRTGELKIDDVNVKQHVDGTSQQLAVFKQLRTESMAVEMVEKRAVVNGFGLEALKIWQKASDQQYHQALGFEGLTLSRAELDQDGQNLETLAVSGLTMLARLDQAQGNLVSVDALNVSHMEAANNISVGDVSINGLDSYLEFHPEQGLNVSNWFGKPNNEPEQKPKTVTGTIIVNKLSIGEQAKVTVVEHALGKPQTHQLSKLKVVVGPLVIGGQSKPANVDISAHIEQSGELAAKGIIVPDANALLVDLKGNLQYLALPAYSNYSQRHIGYRIEQGQLDVDFKVAVKNNQIDSDFALLLKKFELGKLQQFEQSPANEALGVPLPTALNLLRDNDGSISLSIPIKGDLDHPDFSLSGVVSKVTFKALKTAVLYTYSPLGLLSVASGIVDLATALRFKPLVFAPQSIALDNKIKAQLDKTGLVLNKKSKVELVLCANATLLDLPVETVTDEAGKTVEIERKRSVEALSIEQTDSLLNIATQRQNAAQAYLVEKHGVAAHRLLLCNVKFDKKSDSQPVVAISI